MFSTSFSYNLTVLIKFIYHTNLLKIYCDPVTNESRDQDLSPWDIKFLTFEPRPASSASMNSLMRQVRLLSRIARI